MNRKMKERLTAVGLWITLLVVIVYILARVFPVQAKQAWNTAKVWGEKAASHWLNDSTILQSPLASWLINSGGEGQVAGEEQVELSNLGDPAYAQYEDKLLQADNEGGAGNDILPQVDEAPSVPSQEALQQNEDSAEEVNVENTSHVRPVSITPNRNLLPQIETLPQVGGLSLTQMLDFHYLIDNLYVVDGTTCITENELNPQILLSKDLAIQQDNTKPQILIYHTHSQEAFADSVPGDVSQTIVGVGDKLTQILEDTYGYNVIHHTGQYDLTDGKLDRDPAYSKAAPEIQKILDENPSIEVVIDLHRDGVREDVHLVTEVNGKPTARLMFFNGLCRDKAGERTDITNPYREDNLAFSLQMALTMEAYYPDLLRVVYLKTNRYNQHMMPKSILIEVGAQTNTVEEEMNAVPIIAELLNEVLKNKQ